MLSRRKIVSLLSVGVVGAFVGKLFGQSTEKSEEITVDLSEGNYCLIDLAGNKTKYCNGHWHCVDGPAAEYANGDKYWYQNGQLHRTDGPAVEYANGTKFWFVDGKCHRTDGPAVEHANGYKIWYVNGELKYSNNSTLNYKSVK